MKTALPIFILLFLIFSCKDEDEIPSSAVEICGVKDPVRNLSWLKNMVDEAKKNKEDKFLTIVAVKVKGETIINYYLSYMSCIGCIGYKCDGSRLDMSTLTQAEIQEYQKNVWINSGNKITIWPEK